MTAISASNSHPGADPRPGPHLFGVPIGDLGLFASVIIAGALGLIAFFLTTFFSIFGLMIHNGVSRHHITLDMSYKLIALPVGLLVLVGSFLALFIIWLRQKISR